MTAASLAGCAGADQDPPRPSPTPAVVNTPEPVSEVNVNGRRFSPAKVTGDQGRQLRIIGDEERHLIAFRGAEVPLEPGATADLVVPARAGRYQFVCRVHPRMRGTLVVR